MELDLRTLEKRLRDGTISLPNAPIMCDATEGFGGRFICYQSVGTPDCASIGIQFQRGTTIIVACTEQQLELMQGQIAAVRASIRKHKKEHHGEEL